MKKLDDLKWSDIMRVAYMLGYVDERSDKDDMKGDMMLVKRLKNDRVVRFKRGVYRLSEKGDKAFRWWNLEEPE